eukprot:52041-Eustigmatos_ZCMA.PRE.1
MSEVYTVVIRGGGTAGNHVSGTATEAVFRVDWQRVLPKKYQRFQMETYFRSQPNSNLTVASDSYVVVECPAFPKLGSYDTVNSSVSRSICIAPIYSWVAAGTYYHESPSNSPSYIVDYPTENQISIKLTDLTGTTLSVTSGYNQWMLTLTFTPL